MLLSTSTTLKEVKVTINKVSPFFWMELSLRQSYIVLVAVVGMAFIASCSYGYPLTTQTAEPSTPVTFTPLSQSAITPSFTSTPIPLSRLTATPYRSPRPAAIAPPTSALSPELKVLVTVPISTPIGYVPGQEFYPLDWFPDGRTVAYSWGEGIWIAQEPEYQSTRLASIPGGRMGGVAWSPDGRHLAFYGDQWLTEDQLWGDFIWVIKADGTGLKNLTADLPFDPYRLKEINQWLDDQTLTIDLWHGTGAQSLWQIDTVSGEATQLIGYGQSAIPIQAYGGEYHWSPTHEYIAINHAGYGHLVLVDVAEASELWFSTMEDPPSEAFLDWSQDGQRFLYTERDQDGQVDSLWLWDIAQGEGERLLSHVSQAAFSPDGSRVAFLQQEDHPWQQPGETSSEVTSERELPALTLGLLDLTTGQIVLYGPAGYKAQEVPREPRYWQAGQPVWSADGERIVYWGEEGDVWAVTADGAWQERLTQGIEIVQVVWSPDGGKLALRSFDQAWIVERPSVLQIP